MKVKLLFFAFFAIALGACTKEDEIFSYERDVKVLRERDPNSPLVLFKRQYISQEVVTRAAKLTFSDYLGRSFRAIAYPYADAENLGHAVVDVKKLEADYDDYCTVNRIGHSVINSYSFASFDRYLEKSQVSRKVNSGFNLNLGLFKIGHKRKMTEVFGTTVTDNTQSVFGELNVAIDQNVYEMQYSSNIRARMMEKYLTATFKDELYNTPIDEFYNNYGAFVLKKFVTGGRATAFYAGLYKDEATTTIKEKALDNEISGSFSFKNIGASADFSFGKKTSGSGTSTESGVTELYLAIETVGGSPAYPIFTIPQKLDEISLDLSPWMSSLTDTTTHSIVDIADEGLIPITDFILEDNMKNLLNLKIKNSGMRRFYKEPLIIFEPLSNAFSTTTPNLNIYLYTRNNEFVTLERKLAPVSDLWLEKEAERYSRIFGLQINILKSVGKRFIESNKTFDYDAPLMERSFCFRDADGCLYILDQVKKIGLSIHSDYLLDTYALRNFVKTCPYMSVSYEELNSYKLFAL